MSQILEHRAFRLNGFAMVGVFVGLLAVIVWMVLKLAADSSGYDLDLSLLWYLIPTLILLALIPTGYFIVQPNEARVLVLFGRYVGSVRESGFWWTNPFTVKHHISLRIRNFNSEKIKVNDLHGNPIEIAAVIVWKVVDTAKALFDVDNYEQFVDIQSETAIRALASEYPYDAQDEVRASLRGNPHEVAESLQKQVLARLEVAGVAVIEARISHLAYAPEIAQAMLRRQQAQAIVAARQKIVDGAVGMVETALRQLSEHKIIELDEDKKATMVNNLMVALVSEREVSPVINTGSLYQ